MPRDARGAEAPREPQVPLTVVALHPPPLGLYITGGLKHAEIEQVVFQEACHGTHAELRRLRGLTYPYKVVKYPCKVVKYPCKVVHLLSAADRARKTP